MWEQTSCQGMGDELHNIEILCDEQINFRVFYETILQNQINIQFDICPSRYAHCVTLTHWPLGDFNDILDE